MNRAEVKPKTRPKKRISFQDVARLAKVSTATVSRVARGNARVDEDMERRIRDAAGKLGLSLEDSRHDRLSTVAFLLCNRDVHHTFQSLVLLGAEAYCAANERELLFISFRYPTGAPANQLHLPRAFERPDLVRGVILSGTNSAPMLELLRSRKIPFAVLGNNVIGEWTPEEYHSVFSDDVQGAFDLTNHLISQGHRDIWFFGDLSMPWYSRCAQGYRSAIFRSRLEPRCSEIHADDQELGYLAMRSVLSRHEPVTAVFAGSDQIARGVYEALRQSNLDIPGDVSVAGFNDTEGALFDPPLTSVREFPEQLGQHLAELAMRALKDPLGARKQMTIPTKLVVRQSTGAPPKGKE
jgi:LacI family transcriptional regulator, galactose operon repressor